MDGRGGGEEGGLFLAPCGDWKEENWKEEKERKNWIIEGPGGGNRAYREISLRSKAG